MYHTAFVPYDTLIINYYESPIKNDMKVQHYHDTLEIYLQTCGERYLFLNDICYTLRPGDLYLLKPFEIHYTESREADYYGRYLLNFSEEQLDLLLTVQERRSLMRKLDSGVYHLSASRFDTVHALFRHIEETGSESGLLSQKLQYTYIFQLLMELSHLLKESPDRRENVEASNIRPELTEAIHYLNSHYQEPLSLDMVAEAVHMSKYHFSRLFHRATGATFLQYLNNIRLTRVHRLLLETRLPLTEIAKRTGFTSAAQLSRVFRGVYHSSPTDFRREGRDKL